MSVNPKRLYSLDVFRGMTISLMILVNIPGSWSFIYAPFKHADWHGCTPTDLVFPFFLFIVGSSMAFSFQKFNYQLKTDSFFKLLERTFLIFAIGFFLNNFPFFNRELSGNSLWENILAWLHSYRFSFPVFFIYRWFIYGIFFPKIQLSTKDRFVFQTIGKNIFDFCYRVFSQ